MIDHLNDLDAIEARAKAATPGPWRLSEMNPGEVWAVRDPADWDALLVATTATRLNPADVDNTPHIAGMDPEQTLALVAEVRELRVEVTNLTAAGRAVGRGHARETTRADAAEAEVERLLSAIEEQDWQRWQERAECAEAKVARVEAEAARFYLAGFDYHAKRINAALAGESA